MPQTFERELAALLNIYSQENGSDTPDFILAAYLVRCLDVWNKTLQHREQWYGRESTGLVIQDTTAKGPYD